MSSTANPPIVGLKLLAFCVPLSGVAWSRYQNLLLLDAGYSPTTLGVLRTSSYFGKIIFSPVWAVIGDMLSPLWLLVFSYVAAGLSLELVRQCLLRNWPFLTLFVIKTIRSAVNCIGPVTESIMFSATRNRKDGETFGKQRMISSVAWGGGSLFVGFVIDTFGLYSIFPYTYIMIGVALILLFYLHVSRYGYDNNSQFQQKQEHQQDKQNLEDQEQKHEIISVTNSAASKLHRSASSIASPASTSSTASTASDVVQSLKEILLHPQMSRVAYQIVLTGFAMTLVDTVMTLQLESEFRTSRLFNGLCTWISIISTIPVYWFGKKMHDQNGAFWMFRVAQATYSVRLMGMGVISATGLHSVMLYVFLCLLQLLHGITFALVWIAATHKLNAMNTSKKKVTTSASTLVSTLYFTIGQGFGNIFWMYCYERLQHNCGVLYFAGWCFLMLNIFLRYEV
jgi:hypothetical protein